MLFFDYALCLQPHSFLRLKYIPLIMQWNCPNAWDLSRKEFLNKQFASYPSCISSLTCWRPPPTQISNVIFQHMLLPFCFFCLSQSKEDNDICLWINRHKCYLLYFLCFFNICTFIYTYIHIFILTRISIYISTYKTRQMHHCWTFIGDCDACHDVSITFFSRKTYLKPHSWHSL